MFGAQAVAVRGAPRATQDIDITVKLGESELAVLIRAIEERGFVHRFPEIADELLSSGSVVPLCHSKSSMEVDLVLANSGLEDLALSRATRVSIAGVEVPVAHSTDLVVMKILAGRGKDLDDVRALLAAGDVDREEVVDLLGQLEAALERDDLVAALRVALAEVDQPLP